jgi:hypothetical protein
LAILVPHGGKAGSQQEFQEPIAVLADRHRVAIIVSDHPATADDWDLDALDRPPPRLGEQRIGGFGLGIRPGGGKIRVRAASAIKRAALKPGIPGRSGNVSGRGEGFQKPLPPGGFVVDASHQRSRKRKARRSDAGRAEFLR